MANICDYLDIFVNNHKYTYFSHICVNICAQICDFFQIFVHIFVNTNIWTNIFTNVPADPIGSNILTTAGSHYYCTAQDS